MEQFSSRTLIDGISFDAEMCEFEVVLGGQVEGHALNYADAVRKLESARAFRFKSHIVRAGQPTVAALRSVSQTVPQVRRAYCDTPGANRRDYLYAQGKLYAAARNAGLDVQDRQARIEAVAEFLDEPISSWTQLTPREMDKVRAAIEGGYFLPDWTPSSVDELATADGVRRWAA